MAQPLVMDSFRRPHRPLGSAAVIAMLATMGLATTRAHSSVVKFALLAISILPVSGLTLSESKKEGLALFLGFVPWLCSSALFLGMTEGPLSAHVQRRPNSRSISDSFSST